MTAMTFTVGSAHADGWEKVDFENGIQSSRKSVKGSKIVAFKGETVINASVERILWVLTNNRYRTEWVDRLKVSQVLERFTPYESIIYQVFKLPFPISNRDYVYRAKVTRHGEAGAKVNIKSVFHKKAPQPAGVRAHLSRCEYVLEPRGAKQTFVRVEVHTDPRGWLPSWLVNLIQKSWPIKTLGGIKRMVNKAYAKDVPLP
jgi:hypothetical protein